MCFTLSSLEKRSQSNPFRTTAVSTQASPRSIRANGPHIEPLSSKNINHQKSCTASPSSIKHEHKTKQDSSDTPPRRHHTDYELSNCPLSFTMPLFGLSLPSRTRIFSSRYRCTGKMLTSSLGSIPSTQRDYWRSEAADKPRQHSQRASVMATKYTKQKT